MAITTVSITDSLGKVVEDVNSISTDLGDVELVVGDSNTVDAINRYYNRLIRFNESAEQFELIRTSAFSATSSNNGTIVYTDGSGAITYTGASAGEVRAELVTGIGLEFSAGALLLDSSNPIANAGFADGSFTLVKLDSAESFTIFDSDGSVIKTINSPKL